MLRVGAWSDVTILDPCRVIDRSTYEQPTRVAEGIDYVMVAGTVAYGPNGATGDRAGRFLGREAQP